MKITTHMCGEYRDTTLDDLLSLGLIDMFQFWVLNPAQRDFLKGYTLVKGVDLRILDSLDNVVGNPVTITFPELELHCDSTGDSP